MRRILRTRVQRSAVKRRVRIERSANFGEDEQSVERASGIRGDEDDERKGIRGRRWLEFASVDRDRSRSLPVSEKAEDPCNGSRR